MIEGDFSVIHRPGFAKSLGVKLLPIAAGECRLSDEDLL